MPHYTSGSPRQAVVFRGPNSVGIGKAYIVGGFLRRGRQANQATTSNATSGAKGQNVAMTLMMS